MECWLTVLVEIITVVVCLQNEYKTNCLVTFYKIFMSNVKN